MSLNSSSGNTIRSGYHPTASSTHVSSKTSESSSPLSCFKMPLLATVCNLIELNLRKVIQSNVEMRTRDMAAGLETRPL